MEAIQAYASQYLADRLGMTEQAAGMLMGVLMPILIYLSGGLTTPTFVRRKVAGGIWAVGGLALSPFLTRPSTPLAAFLEALAGDDAKYEVKRLVREGKPADVPLLTAGKILVEFNVDQMGGVRSILIDDGAAGSPLLPLLDAHEQEWARKAASKRRAEVTERDRQEAGAALAAKMTAKAA